MKQRWTVEDRRRFADGDRLRAVTVPARRWDGPDVDEDWGGDELGGALLDVPADVPLVGVVSEPPPRIVQALADLLAGVVDLDG